jgi:uncharacterized membrane protein (DUF2068 family)
VKARAHTDLWARLQRELGREVQKPDPFVRFIIIERCAKGVLLIAAGTLLVLYHRRLDGIARALEVELNLQTGQRFFQRLLERGLERLGAVRPATAVLLGLGAWVYAAIELTEGIGLARRRRWAEYLTVLATAFFIPFELFEVLRHLTALRVGALLLNVAVVVYLTWKKRLFVGE